MNKSNLKDQSMALLFRSGVCLLLLAGIARAGVLQQDLQNLFTYRNLGAATIGLGVAGWNEMERVGSGLLRTLALTQLVVAPIKVAVRRERPDRSNRLSFPSGHTASSFAVARFFHRCYGHRVGMPLYLFSTFVAAGRMEGDRHFLSDVVMGAFLGTIVGNSVSLAQNENIGVFPRITSNGILFTLWINRDF